MKIVRSFIESGKVVAAICHGPWLLVQADAARGLTMTSYKSIRKDVENAGGKWVDKEVVSDKGVVTSRSPDDHLKAFVRKIIEESKKDVASAAAPPRTRDRPRSPRPRRRSRSPQ